MSSLGGAIAMQKEQVQSTPPPQRVQVIAAPALAPVVGEGRAAT